MVATFEWDEWNGAGKTQTHNLSNCNWGNVDSPNLDYTQEANKIPRGENSYSKYIAGHFSGSYSQIGPNGKLWHSTVSLPTDVTLKGAMTNTFATPTKTGTGDSVLPQAEGSALAVNFGASPETATTTTTTSNPAYSAYLRMQLQTLVTSPTGAIGSNVLTMKYDES
jgi:hypothetical protein